MTEPEPTNFSMQNALSDATRLRLEGVRRGLLHLHKALLDFERGAYEQEKGRVSSGELLQLLIQNPQFSWLRAFSEMVVQIDETLETPKGGRESPTEQDGAALQQQVRLLLKLTGDALGSGSRYQEALQKNPAAVLAHAEVSKLLPPTPEG